MTSSALTVTKLHICRISNISLRVNGKEGVNDWPDLMDHHPDCGNHNFMQSHLHTPEIKEEGLDGSLF